MRWRVLPPCLMRRDDYLRHDECYHCHRHIPSRYHAYRCHTSFSLHSAATTATLCFLSLLPFSSLYAFVTYHRKCADRRHSPTSHLITNDHHPSHRPPTVPIRAVTLIRAVDFDAHHMPTTSFHAILITLLIIIFLLSNIDV